MSGGVSGSGRKPGDSSRTSKLDDLKAFLDIKNYAIYTKVEEDF